MRASFLKIPFGNSKDTNMKNSIKISILALIAIIIFSSCNSSLSITKRRYTKGYYVHHTTRPSEGALRTKYGETHKTVPQEKTRAVASVWEQDNNTAVAKPENKEILTADAHSQRSRPGKQTSSGSVATDLKTKGLNSASIEMAIKDPVKTFKQLSTEIKSSPAAGEALSLLWILIVILLIAYILGLLFDNFGLGWVIHLLLVVILVLLILWLLRIL
jgi:hypothetical protein